MTTRLTMLREREVTARRPSCSSGDRPAAPAYEAPAVTAATPQTLDELLVGAWAGLTAGAPVACPVCDATMEPRWSAGAGVVGGRCRSCGSDLS